MVRARTMTGGTRSSKTWTFWWRCPGGRTNCNSFALLPMPESGAAVKIMRVWTGASRPPAQPACSGVVGRTRLLRPGQRGSQHRGRQLHELGVVTERQRADKDGNGEADAGQHADSRELSPGNALRQGAAYPARAALAAKPMMPSGLPTTNPSRIPQAMRLVASLRQMPLENVTPAFDRANSGRTRNETQSFSTRVRRSAGDSVLLSSASKPPSRFCAVCTSPCAMASREFSRHLQTRCLENPSAIAAPWLAP